MEEILKSILSSKLYTIAIALLIACIIYIIFKKLIAIIAIILLSLFIYSYFSDNQTKNKLNSLKQAGDEETIVETVDGIKKELKEHISKLLGD